MCFCILEPKASLRTIKSLSRKLGFQSYDFDPQENHHITTLWTSEVSLSKFHYDDQVVSYEAHHASSGKKIFLSFIYAACSKHARRRIWDVLLSHNSFIKDPWLVGGDFNVISSWNEKRGGRHLDDGSMLEFNSFIIQSGLIDLSSADPGLSWSNNQQGSRRIYKKLDRIFMNSEALLQMPRIKTSYLPRVQSDHMPILISLEQSGPIKSSFKFQRMWTDHEDFLGIVKKSWLEVSHLNGLINLQIKLTHLRKALALWNRSSFGNVDSRIEEHLSNVQQLDEDLTKGWDEKNFNDLQTEQNHLAEEKVPSSRG
uniref:Endonuclease/exonuclease/phosphatase domain-containing protein n=1 Tax=Kalanchoe fedtschenkoi TaxID=63787 RepID=A0A7N0V2P2_KALFE